MVGQAKIYKQMTRVTAEQQRTTFTFGRQNEAVIAFRAIGKGKFQMTTVVYQIEKGTIDLYQEL